MEQIQKSRVEIWVPVMTAAIGAIATIAVAVIGRLDWSAGRIIPTSNTCKQVTADQITQIENAITGIEERIGIQKELDATNHENIARAVAGARIATAAVRGAC
jgi:hypothetical protein